MTVAITYETQAVASQYIQPVQIRETSLFETVTDVYVMFFFFGNNFDNSVGKNEID